MSDLVCSSVDNHTLCVSLDVSWHPLVHESVPAGWFVF